MYDVVPWLGAQALSDARALMQAGLLRDVEQVADEVRCAISIQGLERVDPKFVAERMYQVLLPTGDAGTIWNVVDILGEKETGFQRCFDLANELQNRDLVKLLYAYYPSKVMVEMTLKGVSARKAGRAYWPAM